MFRMKIKLWNLQYSTDIYTTSGRAITVVVVINL